MASINVEFTQDMLIKALYQLLIFPLQKEFRVPLAQYILKMDADINGS